MANCPKVWCGCVLDDDHHSLYCPNCHEVYDRLLKPLSGASLGRIGDIKIVETDGINEELASELLKEGKNKDKVITPNNLPIACVSPDALMEHEHADHPTYKFPVEVRFYKTPEELLEEGESFWSDGEGNKIPMTLGELEVHGSETHALIYTDGCIALTLYECCYAIFSLSDGKVVRGSLWERGEWVLTEESLNKIRALGDDNGS